MNVCESVVELESRDGEWERAKSKEQTRDGARQFLGHNGIWLGIPRTRVFLELDWLWDIAAGTGRDVAWRVIPEICLDLL